MFFTGFIKQQQALKHSVNVHILHSTSWYRRLIRSDKLLIGMCLISSILGIHEVVLHSQLLKLEPDVRPQHKHVQVQENLSHLHKDSWFRKLKPFLSNEVHNKHFNSGV